MIFSLFIRSPLLGRSNKTTSDTSTPQVQVFCFQTLQLRGKISVAEPHHFHSAPAPVPGKNFDAAPDPGAPAPALPYCIVRQNF
jgi:hypothetical protein